MSLPNPAFVYPFTNTLSSFPMIVAILAISSLNIVVLSLKINLSIGSSLKSFITIELLELSFIVKFPLLSLYINSKSFKLCSLNQMVSVVVF